MDPRLTDKKTDKKQTKRSSKRKVQKRKQKSSNLKNVEFSKSQFHSKHPSNSEKVQKKSSKKVQKSSFDSIARLQILERITQTDHQILISKLPCEWF